MKLILQIFLLVAVVAGNLTTQAELDKLIKTAKFVTPAKDGSAPLEKIKVLDDFVAKLESIDLDNPESRAKWIASL